MMFARQVRSAAIASLLLLPMTALFVAAGAKTGVPRLPSIGLDRLLKMAPDERMRLLAKVVDRDQDFVLATRGPVTGTLAERGQLQAVQSADLVCRVRPLPGESIAGVIKWVVEDGAHVKKGDKVLELDASAHVEQLRKQKEIVARAEVEMKRAGAALERVKQENRIDVKLAEVDQRLAELAVQLYKGNDRVQKQVLTTQVERAALLVEKTKLQGPPREEKASDILDVKKRDHGIERDKQTGLETDIANCVLTAPRDGIVVYYFPDQLRGMQAPITAQGEPVRAGQKLMTMPELSKMALQVNIHESEIYRVRAGQKAKVRVDAFPGQTHTGTVSQIATAPSHRQFFADNLKVYAVTIALDGESKGLLPGMSGEAAITIGEKASCLRLPASAVLGKGKEQYCYVLTDKEVQVRKVTTGVSDGKLVEITAGLKDNEPVLRDPGAAAKRLGMP
jgi:RND family efflux transporter MFP subunit